MRYIVFTSSVRPPVRPFGCVPCKDLWSWAVSSKPFSHWFAIKLLTYDTSCHVRSTACRVLDGFSPYLALIITSMRGYVTQWHLILTYIFKVIWLWHCLFHGLYSYEAQIQPMKGQCVTYHFSANRSKAKVTQVVRIFAVWAGSDLQFLFSYHFQV